ncbi:NADP-dependent oxidoreductase domain-containing protein [Gigaspora rosea]|uniref:NADP-dependent oxidoreductase domain-containing protein n=1 Tax=Gigaspora rosea TaxID=44941 RepID=A0A397VRH8_9GLOM|nr:NADP-dependent oxidoreductase domain-containing protein [Gigaspora rosea]
MPLIVPTFCAYAFNSAYRTEKNESIQDTTYIEEALGALDDYVLLGRSGLRVPPLCLGTETFGEQLGIGTSSKEVFDYYGGNFIDTSNNYNFVESERFLGKLIAEKHSQIVVDTKNSGIYVYFRFTMNSVRKEPGKRMLLHQCQTLDFAPNAGGNHRKSLVQSLDESLKRLGIGYVDILYVHAYAFRTPIEEIMRSLDDSLRSGKALYIAVSDSPSWMISCANTLAELRANNEKNWEIFEVIKIAAEVKKSPAQAEFNWILQKPGVTSPIIGARTKDQIIENLKSLEFKLTPEQMARLDSIFQSKAIPFPNTMFPQIQNQWVVIKFKCPKIFNLLGI